MGVIPVTHPTTDNHDCTHTPTYVYNYYAMFAAAVAVVMLLLLLLLS